MKLSLKPIKNEYDVAALSPLIRTIWREVFPPIIGEAQTEYMLQNYQSPENICREIENGTQYYFAFVSDQPIGYFAYDIEDDYLFISKIYLLSSERGKGISSEIFDWLENQARRNNISRMHLRVNRGNSQAIAVYRHKGFSIVKSAVSDIGSGFVMDDYHMEKRLEESCKN